MKSTKSWENWYLVLFKLPLSGWNFFSRFSRQKTEKRLELIKKGDGGASIDRNKTLIPYFWESWEGLKKVGEVWEIFESFNLCLQVFYVFEWNRALFLFISISILFPQTPIWCTFPLTWKLLTTSNNRVFHSPETCH